MTRLLRLALMCFPAAVRRRDGDYLLDLAAEAAADSGAPRQALSLVRGGLAMRLEAATSRQVAASVAVAAAVVAASAFGGVAASGGTSREVEAQSCATSCADVRAWAASRERDGWSCTRTASTPAEEWRCVG